MHEKKNKRKKERKKERKKKKLQQISDKSNLKVFTPERLKQPQQQLQLTTRQNTMKKKQTKTNKKQQ